MDNSMKKVFFGIICLLGLFTVGFGIMEYLNEPKKEKPVVVQKDVLKDTTAMISQTMQDDVIEEPIGVWEESKTGIWTRNEFFKIKDDYYVRIVYDDLSLKVEELNSKKVGRGLELRFKNGGFAGEYFIITNDNQLLFLNKSGDVFSKGVQKSNDNK